MAMSDNEKNIRKTIMSLVDLYVNNIPRYEIALNSVTHLLTKHNLLSPHIHSVRSRVKDSDHLKDKLLRKMKDSFEKKEEFDITESNLFTRIDDLIGVRILHLHTSQFEEIHKILLEIFHEQKYEVKESFSYVWDNEYSKYFSDLSMVIKEKESLYTSVHYVIDLNMAEDMRCEIQVRTLMEEAWGEVDHKINYPHKSKSIACREQIKVLARITSSGTRLVDSIFKSFKEHEELTTKKKATKKKIAKK